MRAECADMTGMGPGRRDLSRPVLVVLFALTYFAANEFSFLLEVREWTLQVLWPGSGLAAAAVVCLHRRDRCWVLGRYGGGPARALREFQHAATELAFLRDRLERGLDVPDFPARERELLTQVARARAATRAG